MHVTDNTFQRILDGWEIGDNHGNIESRATFEATPIPDPNAKSTGKHVAQWDLSD